MGGYTAEYINWNITIELLSSYTYTTRSFAAIQYIYSSKPLKLLAPKAAQPQSLPSRLRARVKTWLLPKTNNPIASPDTTQLKVVIGGCVEDATVIPNG